MNERFREIAGYPVTMFDKYPMNVAAYHEILKTHPNLLNEDCTTNFVTFVRCMTRAFFNNAELLNCNVEGSNGLQQLCPVRLAVLTKYARHYYPLAFSKSERRIEKALPLSTIVNTVLRHRRNDAAKKAKGQA